MAFMKRRLTIDSAGRVLLPKPLLHELDLGPGDALELESAGGKITLHPVRAAAPLAKEQGVWVFRTGQALSAFVTDDMLRRARETQ